MALNGGQFATSSGDLKMHKLLVDSWDMSAYFRHILWTMQRVPYICIEWSVKAMKTS